MEENTNMPTSNRDGQMNALASIIPQIMNAVGGGDARIQTLLQQQQAENAQRMKALNVKHAMRNIMNEAKQGKEITPELIQSSSDMFNADPMQLFQAIQAQDQFRKQKRAEQTEQNTYAVGKKIMSMPGVTQDKITSLLSNPDFERFTDEERMKGATIAKGMMPETRYDKLGQGDILLKDGEQIAQGMPKVDKPKLVKVDDGQGGWKFVTPEEGLSGMDNPGKQTGSKTLIERPRVAKLMASGYFPSGRITAPMLDAMEAAAEQAEAAGKPLTPDDLYDMEFKSTANRSTGSTSGRRLTVARKQNIEAAYGLLDDMEKANEKLNYSNVDFIGKLEKWGKGQLNDPVFTEYMTQRADALFVLGNALKQNGLTDKSIEVEEEAAKPTLSPTAFKSWVKVQRRALDRAAEEMNKDFKFDIKKSDEQGTKGQPTGKPYETNEQQTPTAINPQTGEKIFLRNGQWVKQ
jgi:hypothetical protein